jgi:release factor glutamine methyltransferase
VNAPVKEATIAELLRESGLPRREAEVLLCSLLGREPAYLIAHADEVLELPRVRAAQAWFSRRHAGDPVAYIRGRQEFYGLSLQITADVLIPRAETELLVDLALERVPPDSTARVLELGTGCGAIAIALMRERPGLSVLATDVSEAALELARANARSHEVTIDFSRSDWFAEIAPGRFDLIASNPPYVAAADAHLQQGDLRFEPRVALVGGEDGMACIRAIAAGARGRIRSGGWLLMEHGYDQGERCRDLLRTLGYRDVEDFEDLAGIPRVCVARG